MASCPAAAVPRRLLHAGVLPLQAGTLCLIARGLSPGLATEVALRTAPLPPAGSRRSGDDAGGGGRSLRCDGAMGRSANAQQHTRLILLVRAYVPSATKPSDSGACERTLHRIQRMLRRGWYRHPAFAGPCSAHASCKQHTGQCFRFEVQALRGRQSWPRGALVRVVHEGYQPWSFCPFQNRSVVNGYHHSSSLGSRSRLPCTVPSVQSLTSPA